MISTVVITKNEESNIARCLSSLTWSDEIVVVDAKSSDQTAAICTDPQAPWSKKIKFIQRDWINFNEQRNFAISQPKNDWLLVLDADEQCSPELAQKVMNLVKQGSSIKGYKVKRIEYFLGKPIEYGIWNPSYQDRFFNRTNVRYVNEIHEYPVFQDSNGKFEVRIHEPIYHSPHFDPEKFLYKMNVYTSIEAKDRFKAGQRTNAFRLLFAFPAMFLKNYFYYKAYRDGMHGFVISLLEGVSRVVRHVKIWRLMQENRK
jgi:(heptosyl)LPS beta-1,4-glucosyltransferase